MKLNKSKALLAIALVIGMFAPVLKVKGAATYYVAPASSGGSDSNPCSLGSPCLTVKHGLTVMTAGDILYMRADPNHSERLSLTYGASGVPIGTSFSNAITISAYPGETVVWTAPSATDGILAWVTNDSGDPLAMPPRAPSVPNFYYIVNGIIFDGQNIVFGNLGGLYASHIRIQNCESKNATADGLLMPGNYNEFINLDVHNNGSNSNQDHGLYINYGHDNLVDGGRWHDQPHGYGIQIYQTGTNNNYNNTVRNARIYDNDKVDHGGAGGMVMTSGANNRAYNNLVYNNDGVGIQVGAGAGCHSCEAYNNTVTGNQLSGIILYNSDTDNAIVKNNIVYNNGSGIDNNGVGSIISSNILTNPSFTNAAAFDFTLTGVSNAISVGADLTGLLITGLNSDFNGVMRPSGSNWDIGAYQYISGVCSPAHLTFISQPSNAVLGASLGSITVFVQDGSNNICTGSTAAITLQKHSGATWGSLTSATSLTKNAVAGAITWTDVSVLTTAGSGSIDAIASGITSAVSSSFTISAAVTTIVYNGVHAAASSVNAQNVTTASITTTGATLLYGCVSSGDNRAVITDSKSNTWVPLTVRNGSTALGCFYSANPVVGTLHTFTATYMNTTSYPAIAVMGLSGTGVTPFDTESGTTSSSGVNIQPGSISPSSTGNVAIVGLSFDNFVSSPASSGYTVTDFKDLSGSTAYGIGLAYKIGVGATENPLFSWSGAAGVGIEMADFKSVTCVPSKLVYTSQPTGNFVGGLLGTITLSVQDSSGNVCTGSSASVTLAKTSGSGYGTLNSSTSLTKSASSGVVSWTDVYVTGATGTGTIDATSSGLTTAVSSPFSISSTPPFSYYQTLTVQSGQVTGTLSNFTTTIYGTNTNLRTVGSGGFVQSASGYDIGFYTSNNCSTGKLNWETVSWDGTTGAYEYWFLNSSITVGSVVYLCYGNAGITTDQSNMTGAWDSSYKAVYHMQAPSGTSLIDSTASPVNGVKLSSTEPNPIAGKILNAQNFDGTNDTVTMASAAKLTVTTALSISAWVKPSASSEETRVFEYGAADLSPFVEYNLNLGGQVAGKPALEIQVGGSIVSPTAATALVSGTTYNIAGVYNNTNIQMYVNGATDGSALAQTGSITHVNNVASIGYRDTGTPNSFFAGFIDEVHVSNVARTGAWIAAEYNNENAPFTFFTQGAKTNVTSASPCGNRIMFFGVGGNTGC